MVVDRCQCCSNPKVMKSGQRNLHFSVSNSRFNLIFDATEDTPTGETVVIPAHEAGTAHTTTTWSRSTIIAKRKTPPIAQQPLHNGTILLHKPIQVNVSTSNSNAPRRRLTNTYL
ncbi:hypothetical protein V6N13_054109 [Hibiscus sabdariffa]